jgi:hypothetical protein
VLGNVLKEKTTVASPFFGMFTFDRIPKKSTCICFFTVSVPVNYTREFRKRLEAAMYEYKAYACTFLTIRTTFKINKFIVLIHGTLDRTHVDPYD